MATRKGRALLTRESWTRAALDALAAGGARGVAVDRLAKALGATRGSFYWHFSDRRELLDAALELWERENTTEFASELLAGDDPVADLRTLLREAYEKPVDPIEITLASAGDDPLVAGAVARVTGLRLDILRDIFTRMGLDAEEADSRAWLAYAFYIGHHELGRNDGARRRRPEDLERVVQLLAAPVTAPRGRPSRRSSRPGA